MKLFHHRLKLKESQDFILAHHRHSKPLKRHVFSIGVSGDLWGNSPLYGVLTVDRPSSGGWSREPGYIEFRRICIDNDIAPPNTSSFLIGKARQACFAMGYYKIITYTKPFESGSSLLASGFECDKYDIAKYTSGAIKGYRRWVSIAPSHAALPPGEPRAQTIRLLKQSDRFLQKCGEK